MVIFPKTVSPLCFLGSLLCCYFYFYLFIFYFFIYSLRSSSSSSMYMIYKIQQHFFNIIQSTLVYSWYVEFVWGTLVIVETLANTLGFNTTPSCSKIITKHSQITSKILIYFYSISYECVASPTGYGDFFKNI